MTVHTRGSANGYLIYRWLVRTVRADKSRLIDRLSAAIEHQPDGCITYKHTGGMTRKSYRRISAGIDGRLYKFYAHHVFWTLAHKRPIGVGMEIDHSCCRPDCCNPKHLFEVTPDENTYRRNHG